MGSGNSKRTHAIDHVTLEGSSRRRKPVSGALRSTGRGGTDEWGARAHIRRPQKPWQSTASLPSDTTVW